MRRQRNRPLAGGCSSDTYWSRDLRNPDSAIPWHTTKVPAQLRVPRTGEKCLGASQTHKPQADPIPALLLHQFSSYSRCLAGTDTSSLRMRRYPTSLLGTLLISHFSSGDPRPRCMFWDPKPEMLFLKATSAVAEPEAPEASATSNTAQHPCTHTHPTSHLLTLSPPQRDIKSSQRFHTFLSAQRCWKGTVFTMDGLTRSEVTKFMFTPQLMSAGSLQLSVPFQFFTAKLLQVCSWSSSQ